MQEKRLAGNIHQHDCWWVDYKLAVDSIRYRLWLLEKHLRGNYSRNLYVALITALLSQTKAGLSKTSDSFAKNAK